MTMHNGRTWMKRILQGAVLVAVAASVSIAGAAQPGIQVNNVAAGAAAVSRSGAVTTVRTATDRTIINYQRLSVGAGETLNFVQPSASSRVLNRIQGNTPTQIDGTLLSNGQVYLLNPSGVMFGNGAVVNVGGLFAAAGHMSDADFMAGNNLFSNNQGLVRNDGVIQANEVHLLGLNVENFGQIIATPSSTGGGVVTMSAGKDVYIGETSSPAGKPTVMVKISSDGNAGANSTGVRNAGTVDAGAGSLHMGAGDVYAAGLYNSGTLKGRNIALNSGANSNISTGRIDASNANGKGGSVALLGKKVGVFDGTVDASGTTGGGEILVGGDVHGGGGVPVSQAAVVSDAATIRADGTAPGANGGKVIVFSSENTKVGGTLSTLNGAGGIGGFIETSSLGSLLVTHAPLIGDGGTWLLDPLDVTINGGPTTPGAVQTVASNDTTFTATTDPVVIDVGDITTALTTGNVTITTTGGVTWSPGAPMSYALGGAPRTLTISAGDVISLGSSITPAAADVLNINISTTGDVVINAAINTNGGTFHSTGAAFATLSAGSVSTGGAQFTLSHSGLVSINGPISAGAGNMSITSGRITQGATVTANNLDITATDAVDLSFANPVNRLAINETVAGKGVTFASTADLIIGNAGGLSGVTLNGGDLVVLVSGTLFISSPVATHNGQQRYLVSDLNITAAVDAGTGIITFESTTGAETFGLGATTGRTITIDQSEIPLLLSDVHIGGALQTGDIESKNAIFPHAVALTTTGNLILDDSGGPALGGNVITANVGAISASQATNGVPELIGTGLGTAISLTTTAGIGSNLNRVEIVAPVGNVSVSAGADVFLGGVIGLSFSSVSAPGNNVDVIAAGDINATGAITANNITLNAAGGIGTNGAVAVNATGTVQLTTTVSGGDIHLTPVATNTPTLVIATDPATPQTITIDRAGDLGIGSNITVGANDALVLRAGTGGSPSFLAFAPVVTLSADSILLWSGTGGGAASAVDFTNAPTIVNGAGSPTSFMVRQDADIGDAPNAGNVLNYTLRSDGGAVTVNSVGHLANTNATLIGTRGVTVSGGLNVVSLTVSGNAALTGDVAAVTDVTFNNDLVLHANTALSGAALTVSGVVRSENSNAWTLATTFTGVSTFTGGFATLLVEQLGALTVNAAGGTIHLGNGGTQVLHVTERLATNPQADGHVFFGEDLFLFSNLQLLAGTTSSVLPPGAGDVTFAGTVQAVGAHFTLSVNGAGVMWFQKDVGGNGNPLGGVTTLGIGLPSDLTLLGNGVPFNITVGSPIVFGTAVELHGNTTLTAPGAAGDVTFFEGVSSEAGKFWTLTVNAGGATAFKGDVGATLNGQLGFLKTDSAGQLTLGNGAGPIVIKTLENTGVRPISTGEVSFGESTVTLQDNVTITAGHTNSVATPVDDVTFNILSSNDTFGISVISPGKTWLKGGVNVTAGGRLGFITTDAPGTTRIGNGGALIIRTTAGQTYGDPVTLTGPTNFEGTALAFLGTPVSLDSGAFQLTLMTNALTFASGTNRVQGTGNLIIHPFQLGYEIVVGSAGALPNTLYLPQPTLRALKDGFTNIVIGGLQQDESITIQSDDPASPVVFNDPVLFQALGSTIGVNSPNPLTIPALYGNGNASIILQSDILGLSGSIMTRGNGLAVTSKIVLGNVPFAYLKSYGDVGTNILSTGAVAGNISIHSVDDDSQSSLFLADAQGSVTKGLISVDSVGNSRFTGGFFAFGQNLNLKGNVQTAGPVSIQTNTLTLNGTGASVNNILIDTDPNSGNDAGALTIVGPINGDGAGPVALRIDTSAASGKLGANISLQTVGGVTPLASLDLVTSSGAVSVQAVTTTGHINSTGFGFPFSSFTSTGALTSTGAADIRIQHSGLVTIGGAVTANNVVSRGDIMIAGPTIDIHAGAPIDGGIVNLSLEVSDLAAFPDPFVKVGSPITASRSFAVVGNLQFDKGRFQTDALIRVTGIAESSNLTLNLGAGVVLNAPLNSGDGFSDVSIAGSSVTQNSGIILGRALALASHASFPDPFTLTALNQVDRLSITDVAAVSFKNSKALNLTGAVSHFGEMSIEVVSNPLSITGPVTGDAITFTASSTTTSGVATLNATALTVHGPITLGANANTNAAMTFDDTVFLSNASLIAGTDIAAPALTGSGNILARNINAGTVDITGSLLVGDSINVTTTTRVTGNITATAGHVHIANATITGNLTAGADLAVTGQLSMTGNATAATVDVTGPASITGDLTAGGAATFHDVLTVNNITAASVTVAGDTGFHGLAQTTTGDITVHGNLLGAGTINAAAALVVDGASTFSGNMAAGTAFTITGAVANQNATLTSGGDMTFHSTATLNVTATAAGAMTIGGAAQLSGTFTAASIAIPSGITLSGNLTVTANGSGGMTLGPITGPFNLTLGTIDNTSTLAVGAIGTGLNNRVLDVTFLSANIVKLNGDIYARNVAFNDNLPNATRLDMPNYATITKGDSLLIDVQNTFAMELHQKLSVYRQTDGNIADLSILSHIQEKDVPSDRNVITIGDLNALGHLTVNANGLANRINILYRAPQKQLLSNGNLSATDLGTDIVAGFHGVGAINFSGLIHVENGDVSHRIAFSSFNASTDVKSDPKTRLYLAGNNIAILPLNLGSDEIAPGEFLKNTTPPTVLDIVARGTPGTSPIATIGAIVPRDVQTLQPERAQAISGALKDALVSLGVNARDLRSDEIIDYLIGRAMYDDVPYKLNPGPRDRTIAANRLPYAPVGPTVEAYRSLFTKAELDEQGNPLFENGKPKLAPQEKIISASLYQAWLQFNQDLGDKATPPGFRGYLEGKEKDDAKLATALNYLNRVRDLLVQVKSLGLTTSEYEGSRKVILAKVRPLDIPEEDFTAAIEGPTTRAGGNTAVK